jgi:hypothetical protein
VALGVVVLPLAPHCIAAGDDAAGQANTAAASPDQQVVALLDKLRQQVFAGQTTMPPSDNAVETWLQVTKLTASHLSPGAAKALDDFVHTAHSTQTAEQAAGHGTAGLDLLVFADFAVAELKDHPIDGILAAAGPSEQPSQSLQPSPPLQPFQLSQPEHAVPAEATKADTTVQPPGRDDHAMTVPASAAVAAAPVTSPATAETETPTNATADAALIATYVERGDQMMAIKDISAARKFYEFAVDGGSATATAKLAETYDPEFLGKLGVVGLRPDLEKAVALYRQAAALGDANAQERVRVLNQEAAR